MSPTDVRPEMVGEEESENDYPTPKEMRSWLEREIADRRSATARASWRSCNHDRDCAALGRDACAERRRDHRAALGGPSQRPEDGRVPAALRSQSRRDQRLWRYADFRSCRGRLRGPYRETS